MKNSRALSFALFRSLSLSLYLSLSLSLSLSLAHTDTHTHQRPLAWRELVGESS